MKTVVIGDIHGRSVWKLITEMEQPDRVIFIGDYFDSFDLSTVEQIHNFKEIIEYKESGKAEVIMLIGNHDYHYFPEVRDTATSGYQHKSAPVLKQLVDENRQHLQMAYQMGKFLFTHAGVSSKFMNHAFGGDWGVFEIASLLNDLFFFKPHLFEFGALCTEGWLDGSGNNEEQSPIWIRPKSLKSVNKNTLRKEVIQVVGHTEVEKVDIEGRSTGNRYYFIDCLDTSGQYMIINDNEINFNSWKAKQ